jgi:hypothetical protein
MPWLLGAVGDGCAWRRRLVMLATQGHWAGVVNDGGGGGGGRR